MEADQHADYEAGGGGHGSSGRAAWNEAVEGIGSERVFVEHTISFHLANADRFVVPRRCGRGYVSVGYITVHLLHDQRVQIFASGSICKKNGTPSAVTSMNESVDLPDEAQWVERARLQLIDGSHPDRRRWAAEYMRRIES